MDPDIFEAKSKAPSSGSRFQFMSCANVPFTVRLVEKELVKVTAAVNRWTGNVFALVYLLAILCDGRALLTRYWLDNIYAMQSYCSNKFMISRADFDKQFNMPTEMDYAE